MQSIQVKVSSKVILSWFTILPPDCVSGSQTCTAASKTKSHTPLEVKHFFGALLSNTKKVGIGICLGHWVQLMKIRSTNCLALFCAWIMLCPQRNIFNLKFYLSGDHLILKGCCQERQLCHVPKHPWRIVNTSQILWQINVAQHTKTNCSWWASWRWYSTNELKRRSELSCVLCLSTRVFFIGEISWLWNETCVI